MSGGGGGGGAGGGLITDANARLLVEDTDELEIAFSDTTDRPIIDWDDVEPTTPPTIETGDTILSTLTTYTQDAGRERNLYTTDPEFISDTVFVREGDPIVNFQSPAVPGTSTSHQVRSEAAIGHQPYDTTPLAMGCGTGGGSWSGWIEREWWLAFTVPTKPDDVAGIHIEITLTDFGMAANGVIIYARDSAPPLGVVKSGAPVAALTSTGLVFIPDAYVPAAGETLWIGVGPAWQANYTLDGQRPVATIPAVCDNGDFRGPDGDNSGFLNVSAGSPAWAIFTDPGGGETGTTVPLDEEEDPFEGGNELTDDFDGAPTVSTDSGALVVEGPGGYCVTAVGDIEDDEEPEGVWGSPYALTFQFEVDVLDAGTITIETTRPGLKTLATISLDDPGSLTLATPIASVTEEATVTTGERWQLRIDDRSGLYLRGKLWRVADGEPTGWLLELPLPEEGTEDTLDRLRLCVNAASGQTVTVYDVFGATEAPGGWIRERLGVADGTTDRFKSTHRHRPGTLDFRLAGVLAPPTSEDGIEARLGYFPSPGMTVWITYLAD